MKKIAIFCDGTWNHPQMNETTNVHFLSEACVDDATQKVLYIPGVGTTKLQSKFRTLVHKIGGGAFGWGLGRNVREAYRELCEHYEDGDEIYIFGFSRGAYTARSLAGMIRKCGIIPNEKISAFKIATAWNLYKKSGVKNKPDSFNIWRQRKTLSPTIATSQRDFEMRNGQGQIVNIAYLGVWDTVGALGIPEGLVGPLAKLWNWRYAFHDAELSSLVKNARHAVALDERRVFYEPALWDNMNDVDGNNKGPMTADSPWQQLWFTGSHGIVGGSSGSEPLVAFPLEWIWDGATGLRLDNDASVPEIQGDWTFETKELTQPGRVYEIAPSLLAWRDGPETGPEVHDSVAWRVQDLGAFYRPQTVGNLLSDLLQRKRQAKQRVGERLSDGSTNDPGPWVKKHG